MKPLSQLTAHPILYRVWQAPFAAQKLAPVLTHLDRSRRLRVLDVGCGPGTDAAHFLADEYLGIDINDRKISVARRRFGDRFRTADVTRLDQEALGHFDVILVNSLLHHLDDAAVAALLAHLVKLLRPTGHLHAVELVLPMHRSLARWIARQDQGDHPRPLDRWRALFTASFRPVEFQPFTIRRAGMALWELVYFKGTPSR